MKLVLGVFLLVCQLMGSTRAILAAESKASWQAEWDRTVRAAEQEGQVTVSIGGYGAIIVARVANEAGVMVVVDVVSSLGAVPFAFDAWGVDVAVGGSQKALSASPGIAFVAIGNGPGSA